MISDEDRTGRVWSACLGRDKGESRWEWPRNVTTGYGSATTARVRPSLWQREFLESVLIRAWNREL